MKIIVWYNFFMNNKNKFLIIIGLSFFAFINATYLSYKAYFFRFIDPQGLSSFCDVSGTFSCTEVLRHPLSLVFGISFPWVAFIVYPVLFMIAYFGYRAKGKYISHAKTLVVLSAIGTLFNGFIIYREIVFIHAYCLLCLLCTVMIVSIFALSVSIIRRQMVR